MFRDTERPLYEMKANLFKGLAHPYRIRVLEILSSTPEASVAQMVDLTGLEQSHLSQHLSVLRRHRLVVSERRGSVVFYRLTSREVPELLRAARHLLTELLSESHEQQSALGTLPSIPESSKGTTS